MGSAFWQKQQSITPARIRWQGEIPFSETFQDIYFSPEDGVAESRYVFHQGNQLPEDWQHASATTSTICELGFGSGLNFLLTAELWRSYRGKAKSLSHRNLHYISIEKHPFKPSDFMRAANHWPFLKDWSNELADNYPSLTFGRHCILFERDNITLTLIFMPVEDALQDLLEESARQQQKVNIDHWFLDGFAPAKNQAMWGQRLSRQIAMLSRPGSRLATFSVAAAVKQPLKQAGFHLSKRKGFGRKREMLTAQLESVPIATETQSLFINLKYESPWLNISRSEPAGKVAVIGAGLAGCATAYQLALKGFKVDLLDSHDKIAAGASGAAAGIFHPQLTSDFNYASQFNWLAYLYLLRFLKQLDKTQKQNVIIQQGLTRFLDSEKSRGKLLETVSRCGLDFWVRESEVFNTATNAIDFNQAAAVDNAAFCGLLLNKIKPEQLTINLQQTCLELEHSEVDNCWRLTTKTEIKNYQHIVLACGAQSPLLKSFMPFETNQTRGQTCRLDDAKLRKKIPGVMVEQAYLVPQGNTGVLLGTTFEDRVEDDLCAHSQNQIIEHCAALLNQQEISLSSLVTPQKVPLKGTLGYRLHSQDRLPLVGGAIDMFKLRRDFDDFGQKRLRRENLSQYNLPGIWLNSAYGSHGLLYSLIASQHLTSLISNGISPLPTFLSDALSPVRFAIRSLRKSQA